MRRRDLLRGVALGGGAMTLALGKDSFLWSLAKTTVPPAAKGKRLIVIFLRGGMDSLSALVPYKDPNYYELRSRTAIAPPNEPNGCLPLSTDFGLHPSLAPLHPLWKKQQLSFVLACGSPNNTRSHFDDQYFFESGVPGQKRINSGWLNRLAEQLSSDHPLQVLNLGNTTPAILQGNAEITSIRNPKKAFQATVIDRPEIYQTLDKLYAVNAPIAEVYQQGRRAREALMKHFAEEAVAASQGALPPKLASKGLARIAQLMRKNSDVQIAFQAIGSWDTHVNQGKHKGTLAHHFKALSEDLARLPQLLGDAYGETVIVVTSEFGRSVRENSSRGTDHGRGGSLWLMGEAIKGKTFNGQWLGLNPNDLAQGRDIPVLTDYREPLWSVLESHFGLSATQLRAIFPNFTPQLKLSLLK